MLITVKVHRSYPYYRDKLIKIIKENLRLSRINVTKSEWEIALSSIIRRAYYSKKVNLDEGTSPLIHPLERAIQSSVKMILKAILSCPRHMGHRKGTHELSQIIRLFYFDIYEILVIGKKVKRDFYLYSGQITDLLEFVTNQHHQYSPICSIIDRIERNFLRQYILIKN